MTDPWDPFSTRPAGRRRSAGRGAPPGSPMHYAANPHDPAFGNQGPQSPPSAVEWSLPMTQWVTWSGDAQLPAQAPVSPNSQFFELVRMELPTPRAIVISLGTGGDALQVFEFRIIQGAGRIEFVRRVLVPGQTQFDLPPMPARTCRVLAREDVTSPGQQEAVVQAIAAPLFPDLEQRRAEVLR